ncbi:Synaptotagmin-like protein 2 [Polyrhizophydium stewartii]|uniref:Synaptotagmin-like protein 2 n=1 Tax=Polyrhizophydium stewartii TaxID=2732419 RepID=A0ABR4N9M5_9FUNG
MALPQYHPNQHQQLRAFVPPPAGDMWSSMSGGRSLPMNTVIKFVPQQEAWIVERMGRFNRILEPGLAILIPFLDRISYTKSLKEVAVDIPTQSAITQDNVTLQLDGVLYYQVVDPYKASYGVEDADFAVSQLAQTTMRAEIGQMTLDRTLAERTQLNANIVEAMNHASQNWGIRCLRYEIRDIQPPDDVVNAMHQQVSAERKKRAEILESEGARQAAINVAEGQKQSMILESEAVKARQINHAAGEAEAVVRRAEAHAQAIARIAEAIRSQGASGQDAIALSVAERYIEAFGQIAKEGTTVVVPSNVGDAAGMVTQLLSVFNGARLSHTLIVPYAHIGVTKFENGVPAQQVRDLAPVEKKWDFWTTSNAFYGVPPKAILVAQVPAGETWVVERGGKFSRVLTTGQHFFMPLLDKVRTTKSPYTVVSGVIAPEVTSKNGVSVDAYAVIYFKVTDPVTSTYYVDPQTNKTDSERTLAKVVRGALASEIAAITVDGQLSAADRASIAKNILATVKPKEQEFGLEVSEIEIRGAFPVEAAVPAKLRALDPPQPDFEAPGHDLANDYWQDLLTPPFFEKRVFGSLKQPRTPAATSLEWSVPSPPDFHHFHQVPKMVVGPPEEAKVARAH